MKKIILITIFFVFLSFLSLFFAFPSYSYPVFPQVPIFLRRTGAFSSGWQKTEYSFSLPKRKVLGVENLLNYPYQYPSLTKQATKKTSVLTSPACQTKLSSWLKKQSGKWGVVVYDLKQKEIFSFNSREKFHAASVMKLITAVSVFDWAKENNQEPDSLVWGQSLEQRLTLLVNKSDNDQWADLGALVTLKRTQKILTENGLVDSNIYTNTSSAQDVFLLLQKIYDEELLDENDRQFLFKTMQNTINESRIPGGISKDIPVAHKYGSWGTNIHDAGIIFDQNPYILVVMTNGDPGAESKIAQFSSQVYQIFSQENCQ